MTRSLVTGASGFVGANLARRLLTEGEEVHLLLRPEYAPWRIDEIERHVQIHLVDLQDRESLRKTIGQVRPDRIYHLATYGAYASQNDAPRMIATNVIGTINLVEACLECGFEAFVNTGSSSEYGFKSEAPAESERPEPNSPYAVSKTSATLYCDYIAQSRGVNIATLRLYSVYGPFEEPSRLIPQLLTQGLNGAYPPLVDPEISRDFVYVDDVSEAYVGVASRSAPWVSSVYNVGTGAQTRIREIVSLARDILQISVEPRWGSMPDRSWDTHCWVSDTSRIRDEIGWYPRHTLAQGFEKTRAWLTSDAALLARYQQPSLPG